MLAFKTWLVNMVINDATLQGYLTDGQGKYNMFPIDIDIQPENFPCITYADIADIIKTNLAGVHIGMMQMDIWSITNAVEVENIYERLQQIFNLKDKTTAAQPITGILFWIRQNSAKDFHSPSRRIWRKSLDLKYWTSKTDGS